jgi:hypothetical protein
MDARWLGAIADPVDVRVDAGLGLVIVIDFAVDSS